jgi:hypothetical protein
VAVEATQTIGDTDLGAEDESCALVEHSAGEVQRCHRILRWMLDKHPYVAHQLSVFYRHAQVGCHRDQELEGARNTRFRQVQAAESVIPYVLCGLYCLGW